MMYGVLFQVGVERYIAWEGVSTEKGVNKHI